MATYKAHINAGNGYKSQDIQVLGVINQGAARNVFEARYPGANITAVRIVSNRDL